MNYQNYYYNGDSNAGGGANPNPANAPNPNADGYGASGYGAGGYGAPGAQEAQGSAPGAQGAHVQGHVQNGWQYYNGQWYAVPAGTQQGGTGGTSGGGHQPKKNRVGKFLGGVAMLLACGVVGFGGGIAAYTLMDEPGNQTVVYQAPEDNSPAAVGPTSTDNFSVSGVASKAGQSVVSITTENLVTDFAMGGQVVSGAGSGVIISEDGYIITNHHVVEGAQNMSVTLPDGSEHSAKLVGSDQVTDIAVIKIDVTGLVPAVFGDSENLQVGEFCLAIGNPMGTLGGTVTDGIISAVNRQVTISGNNMTLLQMSAAVSPGNSGGGLFNSNGELIGVVNAKSGDTNTEGLGFAIPANTALDVATQLIEHGRVTGRPALGVMIRTISTEAEAAAQGLSEPGVYIVEVTNGGAASKAGLLPGDRVVSADGMDIATGTDLTELLKEKKVGDPMEIVVERGGQTESYTVILGEQGATA